MISHSPGTLQWYSSLNQQHRYKPYAFGASAPIAAGYSRVPPFQMVMPLDQASITSFVVVSSQTGTEAEYFGNMIGGGLETRSFAQYKIVVWPGTVPILPILPVGRYYAKMSNGVETFYSDEWEVLNNLSDYWRLEYCHGEDFPLPGGNGHIDYRFGYKNFFYLKTEIGKPEYFYEERIAQRDGANLPIQQIRWKNHRFEVVAPEEVCDMLSLIRLHDYVKISRGPREYEVDEISFEPQWLEQGDLAAVAVEFRTDTIVVVNGRGVDVTECVEAGDCYAYSWEPVIHQAVAYIDEGTAEWDGAYYTTPGGTNVPLQDGDLVVVYRRAPYSNQIWLMLYSDPGGFAGYPNNPGEYVYEANTGLYFYNNNGSPVLGSLMTNRITEVTATHVYGEAIPLGTVELWGLLANGQEVLLGLTDAFAFTNDGLEYSAPDGLIAVKIRVSTSICPDVYDSGWWYFEVFALITCAGDYPSDEAAIADGVQAGEYYCLTIDNVFGMPEAVVKRLPPFTGYLTDAGALAALGADVIYQLAAGNDLGMPSGTCRINASATPVYTDDAAAAAGGVAVGEYYAFDPLASGFHIGLIKQRKS